MIIRRGCGILLHITSLPSRFGIGDLGPEAYSFADFLIKTKQSYWQVLPLNPTDPVSGSNSPYSSFSAFAGNPLLISPELMQKDGLLDDSDLKNLANFSADKTDFDVVIASRKNLYEKAFRRFNESKELPRYKIFCQQNQHWLEDFVLFVALKNHFNGQLWCDWPVEFRDRHAGALQDVKNELANEVEKGKFLQFLFFSQWQDLKNYCNEHSIMIMGDMPIYVSYDSADVWTSPEVFKLDHNKKPTVVAGVPPDYFSRTGQLWGNPIYNWDESRRRGFAWWLARMGQNLALFDFLRIDHFRGFVAYWEVPAFESTAINGRWVEVPVMDFFNALLKRYPNLPIIAEDLGVITPDVREVMHHFSIPGMKVLLFAFDESLSRNPYAPHNLVSNCLLYTGTHDNNTILGWFDQEADHYTKERLSRYIGNQLSRENVADEIVRMAFRSVAKMVIVPLQDILGLGAEARMNIPATINSNWNWRLRPEQLTPDVQRKLLEMTQIYGRG